MGRSPKILSTLIDASEIGARISRLKASGTEVAAEAHVVGVSALVIAAKDGQIGPLNAFRDALSDPYQRAFKAYCLVHCRTWLTMVEGDYRVKPETEAQRQDFVQREVADRLKERFTDRGERPPARPPRAVTDVKALRGVERILHKIEAALENHEDGVSEGFVEEFRAFVARLKKLGRGSRARRRGTPAASVAEASRH